MNKLTFTNSVGDSITTTRNTEKSVWIIENFVEKRKQIKLAHNGQLYIVVNGVDYFLEEEETPEHDEITEEELDSFTEEFLADDADDDDADDADDCGVSDERTAWILDKMNVAVQRTMEEYTNAFVRKHTAFSTLDELCNQINYEPSLDVSHIEILQIANAYDEEMKRRGDERRACRYGDNYIKFTPDGNPIMEFQVMWLREYIAEECAGLVKDCAAEDVLYGFVKFSNDGLFLRFQKGFEMSPLSSQQDVFTFPHNDNAETIFPRRETFIFPHFLFEKVLDCVPEWLDMVSGFYSDDGLPTIDTLVAWLGFVSLDDIIMDEERLHLNMCDPAQRKISHHYNASCEAKGLEKRARRFFDTTYNQAMITKCLDD
jgi:hypothetical protein